MCPCVSFIIWVFTAERKITKVKWNESCTSALKPKVWQPCASPQTREANFTGKQKKHFPRVMSHSFLSFFSCAMYGAAAAAWRRAITVCPQGAGQDGEIGTVSAATESMTPQCKHGACARTAFVLQPKDTMRSQSGVKPSTRSRWRACGGYSV